MSAQLAKDTDHTVHGRCMRTRAVLIDCHCPDLELIVSSGISINQRTHKIDTEIEPHITMRCACCFGALD